MPPKTFILIDNKPVEVKLTPQLLEMNEVLTRYRKGERTKTNTFINNPLKFLQVLTKEYNIKWKAKFLNCNNLIASFNGLQLYRIEIKSMDIDIVGEGRSKREAKRNAIFKLHKAYCHKCIKQ